MESKKDKDIEAAAEAPSKKSLKDLIGPVAVTPSITKQSSVDGTTKIDNEGAGVRVSTKYGNINISKNKNTQTYSQDPSGKGYTTSYKGLSYDEEFKVGKDSKLSISANVGKTKDPTGKKGDTKGGTLSFTKNFNKGGICRGGGKAIRGMKFEGVR